MELELQPGDYVSWKSRDGSTLLGRVICIRENALAEYLNELVGIPTECGPFVLVDTDEGMRLVIDMANGLRRLWVQ